MTKWLKKKNPTGEHVTPYYNTNLREGHDAMVKAWRSADFLIPLDAGFSENYHVSPLSILGHC